MSATAEDFEDEYDDYYDDDEGVSGFVILVVGVVILAVFMAIVWFAYQRGTQTAATNGNLPAIAADPTPVKTERDLPSVATGNEEVYDRLEGNTPTEIIVEAPEERDPLEGFTETASAAESTIGQVANDVTETVEDAAAAITEVVEDTSPPPVTVSEPVATQPEPQPQPAAPAASASAASAVSGTHVVQVGAFRSDAEANAFFDRLAGKFGALVEDKRPDIERADLGARGVYHRLRVGPFASREEAQSYCGQLKNGGQDCLVKKL
jgi:cell division septation protein DedD